MQWLCTKVCWKKPKEEQMELFVVIGYILIFTTNVFLLVVFYFLCFLFREEKGTILSSL